MPSGKLYKYNCKVLLCNQLVRSDKWKEHCKGKHKFMHQREDDIPKAIYEVEESSREP